MFPPDAGQFLVIEGLTKRLRALEYDLTIGNYFDRIDRINHIKEQLLSLQQKQH